MDIDYIILMSHLIHLYVIQDHKLFTLRFILNGLGYFFCLGLWSTLILVYGTRCRQWHPTPVLLPGKSHGQGSLVGCSPWGHYKLDTTERLHFHFSLSCIGEGNDNPLQNSCLENPRDGGSCWAVVYGVAQSWTWLKRLSSSTKCRPIFFFLISSLPGLPACVLSRLAGLAFFY